MSKIKNAFLGVLAISMIMGYAMPAAAQTMSQADMQAQITALLAQVAALTAQLNAQGGTMTGACVFTVNLTLGSNNVQVKSLQQALNAKGYAVASVGAGSPGLESTYFGGLTKAAVARFQAANGISPAAGYFGPVTRAALCAMMTGNAGNGGTGGTPTPTPTTTPTPTPTGVLTGGAGSVDNYTLVAGLNNEQVGEGENDVQVAGLTIDNSDSSDIMLTAVRLVFTQGTANHDFRKYADEVSVWLDGKEYARVPADSFTDNNDFSQTISLKDGAVIKKGQKLELVVAVSGISNLDSADEGDTWSVDFDQVRFKDAQNTTISEDPGTATRSFSFESFSSATNTELRITEGDTAVNDAHIIKVDSGSSKTTDEPILSFDVEVRGDSDIRLDDLPVNFTVTGATNVDDVVSGLTLTMDGDQVGSADISSDCIEDTDCAAVGSTETYLFENMDLTLKAGKTYKFEVDGDFYGLTGSGDLDAGDTIAATVGETQTDLSQFTAEDENGDDLADADVTGTVVGEANAVYNVGFDFKLVSTNATISQHADAATVGSTDQGTYTETFDLTAFGGNVIIDRSCKEDGVDAAGQGIEYTITNAASNSTTCTFDSTADVNDANTWILRDGETKRFTLTVVDTPSADHFAKVYLSSINWDDATTNPGGDDSALFYTFGLGEQKTSTSQLFLNVI